MTPEEVHAKEAAEAQGRRFTFGACSAAAAASREGFEEAGLVAGGGLWRAPAGFCPRRGDTAVLQRLMDRCVDARRLCN